MGELLRGAWGDHIPSYMLPCVGEWIKEYVWRIEPHGAESLSHGHHALFSWNETTVMQWKGPSQSLPKIE